MSFLTSLSLSLLLSLSLSLPCLGTSWKPIGPTIIDWSHLNSPLFEYTTSTGSVNDIATHPTDPNILYIGTVNGGVWKTTNAYDIPSAWVPLTDSLPTISIGAIAVDPTNGDVVIAAMGHWSSYKAVGGDQTGFFVSSNGGSTWRHLQDPLVVNMNFRNVYIRGDLIIASAAPFPTNGSFDTFPGTGAGDGGLVRSTDGGKSWSLIIDKQCRVSDMSILPSDPSNVFIFVTSCPASVGMPQGVYQSTDSAATFFPLVDVPHEGTWRFARLSAGKNRVYLFAFTEPGPNGEDKLAFTGYYNISIGGWITLPKPSLLATYDERFSAIVASPVDDTTVFVTTDGDGRVARGDTTKKSVWTSIRYLIHADSRRLRFDAHMNLYAACDGGVYRYNTTSGSNWVAMTNVQNAEAHSASYDAFTGYAIAGLQDNGAVLQDNANWKVAADGDGAKVAVWSNKSYSVSYFSVQDLASFHRRICTSNGCVNDQPVPPEDTIMYDPISVHYSDSSRLLIANVGNLYESFNQGDTYTIITLGDGVTPSATGRMIYGNAQNSELILVPTNVGLYSRTKYSTALLPLGPKWNTVSVAATDDLSLIWVIAAPLDNYSFSVYVSSDGGKTFSLIGTPAPLYQYASPMIYAKNQLIVGCRNGVYSSPIGNYNWSLLGTDLPRGAVVADIEYNQLDGLLIIGTIGRSVWTLSY